MAHWHWFGRGVRDTLPFALIVLLLAAIFGASALRAGISVGAAVAMSALVYSGSAQFAAISAWEGSWLAVLLGALVLNMRFVLMSASLSTRLPPLPGPVRALVALGVTDETYALAISQFPGSGAIPAGYLLGSMAALYLPWTLGTVAGVMLAARVPTGWAGPIDLLFPLVFMTLVVLTAQRPAAAGVAVLGALLGLWLRGRLPAGWHIVVGGVLAAASGPLLERWLEPARAEGGRAA